MTWWRRDSDMYPTAAKPALASFEEWERRSLPNEIRYTTSAALADDAPWVSCVQASIDDGVLAIDHGSHVEWVPVHRIQVAEYRRRKFNTTSAWCAPSQPNYEMGSP